MKIQRLLLALVIPLLCSGCWPMRFTTSPGATGVVLDSQTHQPIDGASVGVSDTWYKSVNMTNGGEYKTVPPTLEEATKLLRPPIEITGTNGCFSIPSEKRWGLYIVPMDVFPAHGTLVVQRHGYEPLLVPCEMVYRLGDPGISQVFYLKPIEK